MINNKIINKTIKILLISIIAFTINPRKGYCSWNFPGGGDVGWGGEGDSYVEAKGCGLYRSSVSIGYDINTKIDITAYDKEGNKITNSNNTIDIKNAIKAGTWVGINFKEIHEAYYSISVTSYEVKYTATCKYTCQETKYCKNDKTGKTEPCGTEPKEHSKTVSGLNKCDKDSFTCPADSCDNTGGPSFSSYTVTAGGYQSSLQQRIDGYLDNIAYNLVNKNVGKIKYIPVNDYDEYKTDDLTLHASGVSASTKGDKKGYVQSYSYSPNKICMNLKNGNVTYKESECSLEKNKIEIKNKIAKDGNEYWHYFVPLNIKSNQNFSIDIEGDKIFTTEQCINFINENKDDYFKLIKPISDKIIMPSTNNEKDRKELIEKIKRAAGTIKKRLEDEGCVFRTGLKIPIIQRFYNEYTDNGVVGFEGFNFYYRPIDINNPFPNGLTNTSIWYDWSKDVDKDPDISKSYNDTTYAALVGTNTSTIRNYTTVDLPYTTWSNMKLDGTSEFIDFLERNNIGKRYNEEINIPYKLGCGDANKDQTNEDGSKNYLYQEWCGNS